MADFDRESMLEMFTFEMSQLLEQLEQTIIQGEAGYSMEQINEIFRIMHTIKGSAAMMLFTTISTTAHAIEDLFFYLREENPVDVDFSTLTDLVLEGMDFIKEELSKVEAREEANGNPETIIGEIKSFLSLLKGGEPDKKEQAPPAAASAVSTEASVPGLFHYRAKIYFTDGCEMENVRAFTLVNNMAPYVSGITHVPPDLLDEGNMEMIRANGFEIRFSSAQNYEEIHNLLSQTIYLKSLSLECADPAAFVNANRGIFRCLMTFEEGSEMENVRAYTVVHNLKPKVDCVNHVPEDLIDESSIEYIRRHGFMMEIITSMDENALYNLLSETIYLKDLVVEPKTSQGETRVQALVQENNASKVEPPAAIETEVGESKPQDLPPAGNVSAVPPKKAPTQSVISVNVNKLDQLLKFMGELVIAEAMVTQNPELEGQELESFHKEARQLRLIIKELQETVMSMRMVPLSTTFFKMNRIVRDMCKQLGKEVQLDIVGEETEVDKNIIEHISDPLMHIIRNSIDHGIEMPGERVKKGKPEKGVVTLEAKNSGSDVLIVIKDDGAGLDKQRILDKARKNGLLRKAENEYTEKEIFQFIFMPGFSTNEKVTSFSGRGVGMDVVNKNLELVGGSVLVDSVPGEGSVFTLKIPLTLAIIEGMIVKVAGAKYTIPIVSIKDSFRPKKKDVFKDPNGNEMITVRDECYNIVRLYEFFGIDSPLTNLEEGIMMIIENGDDALCLFVDDLVGEQQVVVKSMPKYIKKITGVSGCTLLGNGDISLIVDVAGFFDK